MAPPRSETVLVVEDQEPVRKVVQEFLESMGYNVLEARDGDEALRVCQQHPDPIRLMMTDVVMPGMSGYELAQRLAPLRPEMKVLYMSGYTRDVMAQDGVLDGSKAFLQKPFTRDDLVRTVRQLLAAGKE
ncbi:MAG: response regulator [Terriglobia bacterium]